MYAVSMSRVATAHCLIAAAGTDPQVGALRRAKRQDFDNIAGRVSVDFQLEVKSIYGQEAVWAAGEAVRCSQRRLHAHSGGPQRGRLGRLLVADLRMASHHWRL